MRVCRSIRNFAPMVPPLSTRSGKRQPYQEHCQRCQEIVNPTRKTGDNLIRKRANNCQPNQEKTSRALRVAPLQLKITLSKCQNEILYIYIYIYIYIYKSVFSSKQVPFGTATLQRCNGLKKIFSFPEKKCPKIRRAQFRGCIFATSMQLIPDA